MLKFKIHTFISIPLCYNYILIIKCVQNVFKISNKFENLFMESQLLVL